MEKLIEKYTMLYDHIVANKEPKQMKLFGEVSNAVMIELIKSQPALAEKYIEKLCAINWRQYLTKSEAASVLAKMNPAPRWDFERWLANVESFGLEAEREHVFNRYALFVCMAGKYSDEAEVIADKAFGKPLAEVPEQAMFTLIHALAVAALTDKDEIYNIRTYFAV